MSTRFRREISAHGKDCNIRSSFLLLSRVTLGIGDAVSTLSLGISGLLLVVTILVILPLRNYHRAAERGGPMPLTNLFLRIWLFGIYIASLESYFSIAPIRCGSPACGR